VTEEGFEFSSHLDGTRRLLSPEESMRVQSALGSDIAMQLDVCPRGDATPAEWVEAVERTTRWAVRCLDAKSKTQAMFGIVQGGTDARLRRRHLETLRGLPLDGIALGGFSVGEPPQQMHETVNAVASSMPADRPRYLMGVGTPEDLVIAIAAGIDLFDCVLPTRNARNGQAFVSTGRLAIKQARYRHELGPLESGCTCATCRGGFTRAYLRHLYMAGEILSHRLLTLHNLHFYGQLVARARQAILADKYALWAEKTLRALRVRTGVG
jgi:queuine tRNA-ribosyltransferase